MDLSLILQGVLLCVILILPLIESLKTANFLNDTLDNRNWISNYNDDLITLQSSVNHRYVKDETIVAVPVSVEIPGPPSSSSAAATSLPAKTLDTAAFSHYDQWPLWWLTNQTTKRQQQLKATAAATVETVATVVPLAALPLNKLQDIPSSVIYSKAKTTTTAAAASVGPPIITKFNNDSLKLNKLKASDIPSYAHDNDDDDDDVDNDNMNAANGSREVGPMQRNQFLVANYKDCNDIEATTKMNHNNYNGKDYHKQQWRKLQQPTPQHTRKQQHKILKFYTSNALQTPLAFGKMPQIQQQQQEEQQQDNKEYEQEQQQELSLPTPLPQVHFDSSHSKHQLADYRLLYNAERSTKFYLYTMRKPLGHNIMMPYSLAVDKKILNKKGSNTKNSNSNNNNNTISSNVFTHGRVLHVVTDTISAAFGVNTHPVAGIHGIHIEELQLYDAGSLRQSRFNPFNPTRILIHGWLGGSTAAVYNALVPEFLKLQQGSYNIICVDWGKGAVADYISASYRVKDVGKVVAKFLDFLHQESGTDFDNIHVVGFSMGAHVAGMAGKHVQTGRLPVIYGLDPALPLFHYDNANERLAQTDAEYIEIIHTNAGIYGYDQPLGHVDFYINYGSTQPGCVFNECSHLRAFQIFAQSLSNEKLNGIECLRNVWQDIVKWKKCNKETGVKLKLNVEGLTRRKRGIRKGIFYVSTNPQPPYKL